jgi:hypothetical protein
VDYKNKMAKNTTVIIHSGILVDYKNKMAKDTTVIIHSGILLDYKNKMAKDTTMKLMLFERAYSKVLLCI